MGWEWDKDKIIDGVINIIQNVRINIFVSHLYSNCLHIHCRKHLTKTRLSIFVVQPHGLLLRCCVERKLRLNQTFGKLDVGQCVDECITCASRMVGNAVGPMPLH